METYNNPVFGYFVASKYESDLDNIHLLYMSDWIFSDMLDKINAGQTRIPASWAMVLNGSKLEAFVEIYYPNSHYRIHYEYNK